MDEINTKVLLIEDNPGDIRLIREMLVEENKKPVKLLCSNTLSMGLEHVAKGGISVILLDLLLPDSFGLETLSMVRSSAPEVPVVVLTGIEDEYIEAEALDNQKHPPHMKNLRNMLEV